MSLTLSTAVGTLEGVGPRNIVRGSVGFGITAEGVAYLSTEDEVPVSERAVLRVVEGQLILERR